MPNEITVQQYRPSEIIAIFNEILSRQTAQQSGHLIYIRGIYLAAGTTSYNGRYFDRLRDEEGQDEISICVTEQQRQGLTNGNLVEVGGTLGRRITNKGQINLNFNVSRIEIVQDQVIDEDEQKRIEYRLKKVALGFKNVDSIFETLIYNDTRPKIALILAQSSITLNDFEDGIRAAKVQLDFDEYRVTFTKTTDLISTLNSLDNQEYHAIAMVRGGGIDPKTDIDKPEVIETVANLKTPFIAATGHKDEVIFLRQVADKWTATPQGLGQYFSELVESVSEKKSKSRAAITEQIKKQFQQQLEAGKKQNKELQDKLAKLTKAQEDANKKHDEQVKAMTKAQEESNKKHDEQVKAMTKAQEEATKKHNEQIAAIQKQNKEQNEKTVGRAHV